VVFADSGKDRIPIWHGLVGTGADRVLAQGHLAATGENRWPAVTDGRGGLSQDAETPGDSGANRVMFWSID